MNEKLEILFQVLMELTFYSKRYYSGSLNLLKSERALILEALKKTTELGRLSRILKKSEKELLIAIVRHRIVISEIKG